MSFSSQSMQHRNGDPLGCEMLVGENPPQTKKRKVIKFRDDLSNSRTPLSQPSPKSINTTIKNQRSTIMAFISSSSASKYPVRCTVALPLAKMVGRCPCFCFMSMGDNEIGYNDYIIYIYTSLPGKLTWPLKNNGWKTFCIFLLGRGHYFQGTCWFCGG